MSNLDLLIQKTKDEIERLKAKGSVSEADLLIFRECYTPAKESNLEELCDLSNALLDTVFSLLRSAWNSKINTMVRNVAVKGVVGCDIEDMLSLADDTLRRSILYYGKSLTISKFNTFYYNNFKNQVRTVWTRYGVTNRDRDHRRLMDCDVFSVDFTHEESKDGSTYEKFLKAPKDSKIDRLELFDLVRKKVHARRIRYLLLLLYKGYHGRVNSKMLQKKLNCTNKEIKSMLKEASKLLKGEVNHETKM